jgi:hypothetical protein
MANQLSTPRCLSFVLLLQKSFYRPIGSESFLVDTTAAATWTTPTILTATINAQTVLAKICVDHP